MSETNDIVGHKTYYRDGQFSHKALTRDEVEAIIEKCELRDRERAEAMPTEQDAIRVMFDAYQRLKDLGWREAQYCPKDGSEFLAIEAGSTGIHPCFYRGKWPDGGWWVPFDNDLWPSRPILFKAPK